MSIILRKILLGCMIFSACNAVLASNTVNVLDHSVAHLGSGISTPVIVREFEVKDAYGNNMDLKESDLDFEPTISQNGGAKFVTSKGILYQVHRTVVFMGKEFIYVDDFSVNLE